MKNTHDFITIVGAKENNLKNIDLIIPKNKLVVFTGVSGSGKSSLAFNTIYEEGRRRYVDSLSSYARQFLGGTKKPDVVSIDGLSPAISIEQKTTHSNPRSTVGTITEIYDYLRLLYARIGKPFCPKHNIEITSQKTKEIVDAIYRFPLGSKIHILSPVVVDEKGTHEKLLLKLKKEGFLRLKVNGEVRSVEESIILDKNKKHNIDIIVDRLVLKEEESNRISEAIDIASDYAKGIVKVEVLDKQEITFSKIQACQFGDFNMPNFDTKNFSFNSPIGMCEKCKGIGVVLKADFDLLVPKKELSVLEGALAIFPLPINKKTIEWKEFEVLANKYNLPLDKAIETWTKEEIEILKFGSNEEVTFTVVSEAGNEYKKTKFIEGLINKQERKFMEASSEDIRAWHKRFMSESNCDSCKGARLNKYSLAVKLNNLNIFELSSLSIEDALKEIENLQISEFDKEISSMLIKEIKNRLSFLVNVGLEYLSLNRKSESLSGGEAQRIRLATQIGSNLTGVLYVLDEPSIGLHQKDNRKLINSLKKMVEIGNTLIVVEHDEETILEADHVIEIGPLAGRNGGEVVAQGSVLDLINNPNSITGKYLSKEKEIEIPNKRRPGNGNSIIVKGASENNLKNLDVSFPLGKFIAVTGVSGSGKSTLVNEVLVKGLENLTSEEKVKSGKHKSIDGSYNIDKIIKVSQSPIGRTPRSNPATYISVFDDIRDVYASLEESRTRGYLKGKFSFNASDGRCEKCQGDGMLRIEMHFLPDVYITCDHCNGTRYKNEILEIKYKNKNISDILNMTVLDAYEFFENRPKIANKLKTLIDVGLDYITLGQSATTLSGGEAQRVKLAKFLQKKPTGKTFYVLDEPTTGLHTADVEKLVKVLNRIVDNGDTVLVIEHNLDLIKVADYIIDLGPGGGINGGKVIATGTPEAVAKNENSYTGIYLKGVLNERKN
ncbi:excinuclease ABC subunit UvrA [Mesomycoplasma molare]|uniref:UvrABC system protein A n=1 Tax=Mesomycoplasma molare TaxID=171288 RepID=A0ABY5TUR2_9BACT|nr:excinuclease ABC subunit UvrA [Mesomycoplasma molare]UWD34079.1 excinuclease ABC subunit UvrA [Mesomycoplasma molare]